MILLLKHCTYITIRALCYHLYYLHSGSGPCGRVFICPLWRLGVAYCQVALQRASDSTAHSLQQLRGSSLRNRTVRNMGRRSDGSHVQVSLRGKSLRPPIAPSQVVLSSQHHQVQSCAGTHLAFSLLPTNASQAQSSRDRQRFRSCAHCSSQILRALYNDTCTLRWPTPTFKVLI